MVSFRRAHRARPYDAQPTLRRISLLVALAGLVIVLWHLMSGPRGGAGLAVLFGGLAQGSPDGPPIDNRLLPAAGEAAVSALVRDAAADTPPTPAAPRGNAKSGESAREVSDRGVATGTARPAEARATRALARVRDDTPFRGDEADAFFELLAQLRAATPESLEKASVGSVSYAQLFRQSSFYRGKIVSLAGVVRRVEEIDCPPNRFGFQRYFRLALTPVDNSTMVMIAFAVALPEGFPTGDRLGEDVRLTGYYFKRWAYRGEHDLLTTPTLLVGNVVWTRRPPPVAPRPIAGSEMTAVAGVALLAACVSLGFLYWRTRRPRRPRSTGAPIFGEQR